MNMLPQGSLALNMLLLMDLPALCRYKASSQAPVLALGAPGGSTATAYTCSLSCLACAQIEIGQLDDTIGISEVPFGNLSYWFQGSSIVLSIQLNQGMFFQPIGVYVNKTAPPTGRRPPSRTARQGRMHLAARMLPCLRHARYNLHGKSQLHVPAML